MKTDNQSNVSTFRCWTAVGMLASGVAMSFIGFFIEPMGEISNSTLWFTAQSLIYAGSALGIDVVIDQRITKASARNLPLTPPKEGRLG